MGKCARCGAEADLYENGTPLCFNCSERIEGARKQTARAIVAQRELQSAQAAAVAS
jgi:DNA-directed RNA polymerase subunit RPC12/RpoP